MRIVALIKAARHEPNDKGRLDALAPCDAAALRWGLEIARPGDELIAVTAGPASSDTALVRALSLGAHRALRVWVPEPDVPLLDDNVRGIAELLAATLRHLGDLDLVLCGARSADWASGITGPAVAFELDLPHLSQLSSIALKCGEGEGELLIEALQPREDELVRCQLPLPALLAVETSPQKRRCCETAQETDEAKTADQRVEVLSAEDVGFEADDPLPWPPLPLEEAPPHKPRVLDAPEALLAILAPAPGAEGPPEAQEKAP